MKNITSILISFFLIAIIPQFGSGQEYFGKNKPRYRSFDFEVTNSPHFEFYTYTKNRAIREQMIELTEQWYDMHLSVLKDTFETRNPIIFYNNHAEFQQTNAIFGSVGVGTGGVTEGFKNRVIMPYTMINQQTAQVLGHELVHAFQFHMIINGDSTSLQSLANLPLWMVEGMAEYLSIGRVDPYTSMWMRDAVLNDDVPTIKEMFKPKYFPYRYGQAFWSFISGYYGDDTMKDLFLMTAKYGVELAIDSVLNTNMETLSGMFTEGLKTHFTKFLGDDLKENKYGTQILTEDNAGRLNLSPVVSPNGKYLIFFSDKNLFTTDLYLADARNGKIIRKVNSLLRDGDIDDFSYLESAGTWSPKSDQFAFVAFKQGRNVIVIKDVSNGKTLEEIKVPKVTAIGNPAWSPKGDLIAFSGMVEGQTDLFLYNLKSKRVTQLTDDMYSEVQANWDREGTKLAFSTDRLSMDRGRTFGRWSLNIAEIDVESKVVNNLDLFFGADNTNPNYDPEGRLYFLSDRDGFRNLYRFDAQTDSLLQMTDLKTGISGIGRYSPALSASKTRDRVAFTHYFQSKYEIYQVRSNRMLHKVVSPDDVNMAAGTLPVVGLTTDQTVMENIIAMDEDESLSENEVGPGKYQSRFKLDYIQGSTGGGIGVGTYNTRTALAGGIDMIFSDIMGNHQLFATAALNGEIYDFGASVQYLNRKNRMAWGIGLSHVPLRTGFYDQFIDTSTYGQDFRVLEENLIRIFEDQLSLMVQYPFSKTLRWEASAGATARFYRYDRRDYLYDPFTGIYLGEGQREKIPIIEAEQLLGIRLDKGLFYNVNTAVVGDNTFFGLTSPLNGYRFRFDYSKYFGLYDFSSATADIRLYQYLKPISFAFRATHFARLGNDANSFYPILVGQMGLVRGYTYGRVQEMFEQTGVSFNQLSGSKFIVTGFEVRLPFTGPKQLAVIKSNVLLTDLSLFFDAGIAFNDYSDIGGGEEGVPPQKWATSAGVSLRVNLFGAMIIEPYYAIPLINGAKGGAIGVNLVPGW